MANTNWFKGIDDALSTPGGAQVALAGYYFIDAINGSDSTGDGSPDDPFMTISYAITQTPVQVIYILADAYYNENINIIIPGQNIESNKKWGAVVNYNKIQGSDATVFKDVIIKNTEFRMTPGSQGPTINGCIVDNCSVDNTSGDSAFFENSIIINSDISGTGNIFTAYYDSCTIFNSTVEGYSITNTDLDFNSTFILKDDDRFGNPNVRENCNFRGTLDNTTRSPDPFTTDANNIDLDSLYVGDPNDLELTIQPTSPLIGAGENGTTIGAFKVGELVDLSSPAENNDITIGATIEITNPATTGNIKPQLKTFSQIRKSPIVAFNGLPDNTDNVPDNETTLIPPKRKTINILWRETVGGADLTGEFLYNVPMYQDNSGNKTGEDDFNPFDIASDGDIMNNTDNLTSANLIDVAEIQENFVLNDQ